MGKVKDKTLGEAVTATAQVGPAAVLYVLALAVLYSTSSPASTRPFSFLGIASGVAEHFLFADV